MCAFCRFLVWLSVLLSVTTEATHSRSRRLLHGNPVADARGIGGALGKVVKQAATSLFDAIPGAMQTAAPQVASKASHVASPQLPAPSLPAATTIAAPAFTPAFVPASSPATEGPSGADKWAELVDSTAAASGSAQALYAMQVRFALCQQSCYSSLDSASTAPPRHKQSSATAVQDLRGLALTQSCFTTVWH